MNSLSRFSILCATLALAVGCSHAHKKANDGAFADTQFKEYHQLYFTAQPSKEALLAAQKQGMKVVVNLRTPAEMKKVSFNEKTAVEKAGMTYYNLPVSKKSELDKNTMMKVEKTVMKHHKAGEKVLIHCSSGQRAAAWFATHVYTHHKDKPEKAMKMSKMVGLSKDEMIQKTEDLLKKL